MAVNPVTVPVPQNNNLARAMYVYLNPDPIGTDINLQNLLNFSRDNGVNFWFLDIYTYLGGANWTPTKLTRMQLALEMAHKSGIRVYAYAGDVGWGQLQAWVMKNIIQPLKKFQDLAIYEYHQFDGVHFDVEYWNDEVTYDPTVHLPGLCDLAKATRTFLSVPVSCFAGWFLKDNTGTRPSISYNGKSAQDGEHMMDVFDNVVVGNYRDHANDNGTDGIGQISMFQPWYDYASQVGKNFGLFAASETINISPAYVTYFGQTKTAMEAEHTLISNAFRVETNATFLGQCVHEYNVYKGMSA